MRILYLCSDLGIPVLGRKGASVHVRSLIAALSRAGHAVVLAAPLLTRSPWEEAAPLAATLLHLPPGPETSAAAVTLRTFNETLGVENPLPGEVRRILYNQDLKKRLKRHFENNPPDFIYERASLYGTAGVGLARTLNVPLLLELNAPLAVEQSAYRGTGLGELAAQAERWALTQADAVLVVSEPLRDYAVSLGVSAARVPVVPNGVDPTVFVPRPPDPQIRARWGLNRGPAIGFVGGLRPWHGVEVLPALLAALLPRYDNLRLVIVGDGPLREELARDLGERGLLNRVVFTGALPHEDVAEVIRQLDVALAPYPRPPHTFYFSPLKLFEYMACGVPVVAAALGQIAEVVRDGENGLLYPPGDLPALVAACDRLLADPALRRRLGRSAAAEVRTRYTWDENARRVVEIARQVAGNRGPRSCEGEQAS